MAAQETVSRQIVADKLRLIRGFKDGDTKQPIFEERQLTEFEKYLIERLDKIEQLLAK